VQHGIEPAIAGGKVTVEIFQSDEKLVLKVSDRCCNYDHNDNDIESHSFFSLCFRYNRSTGMGQYFH